MHGQVVQAIQGQRQHYRPIQSQLTDSHALLDVVATILQVYPFDCVYIADLNAITGDTTLPDHRTHIMAAMQAFPQITWWIDAGLTSSAVLEPWQHSNIQPVLASESLPDIVTYQTLRKMAPDSVLSLDYFQDGFHGPASLEADHTQWTQPTIVMSLPKVGTHQGPDLDKLTSIKQRATHLPLYAAGGVRNIEDIQAISQSGGSGILIASALHHKTITASDMQAFTQ